MSDLTYKEVLLKFPVLHEGWEMGSLGKIVLDLDNTHEIVLTNHGKEYYANPAELHAKLLEYSNVIAQTIEALKLVT